MLLRDWDEEGDADKDGLVVGDCKDVGDCDRREVVSRDGGTGPAYPVNVTFAFVGGSFAVLLEGGSPTHHVPQPVTSS